MLQNNSSVSHNFLYVQRFGTDGLASRKLTALHAGYGCVITSKLSRQSCRASYLAPARKPLDQFK